MIDRHLRHHGRRRGFTLIELACASAIAVILMIAVLGIFTSIARDRIRLTKARSAHIQDRQNLIELLYRDLAECNDLSRTSAGEYVLQTRDSLDSANLEPSDRFCAVTYSVMGPPGAQSLFRRQQLLDDPTMPPPQTNLVAMGVSQFDLIGLGDNAGAARQGVLASRMRVVIGFDDKAANIDQIICVH
jgi:prepilin-type N-terminal cleavage/methylation domain-containing protein